MLSLLTRGRDQISSIPQLSIYAALLVGHYLRLWACGFSLARVFHYPLKLLLCSFRVTVRVQK